MSEQDPAKPKDPIDYSIPGMRIQAGDATLSWGLVVRCVRRREDWIPEPQGAAERVSVMVTPTTIRYQGRNYRIHEAEATESGWIYRMQPCPEGETSLHVVELEREKVTRIEAENMEFKKIQTRAYRSASYEILLGWLPSRWQEALSQHWQFSPADATRKNGMAAFLMGLGGAMPATIRIHPSMGFVMILICLDGAIRWVAGFVGDSPLGILPLEVTERTVHWGVKRIRKVFEFFR